MSAKPSLMRLMVQIVTLSRDIKIEQKTRETDKNSYRYSVFFLPHVAYYAMNISVRRQFRQVNWESKLTTAYYTSCLSFIFSIRKIPHKPSFGSQKSTCLDRQRPNKCERLCALKQFVSQLFFILSLIKLLLQEPNRIFGLSMLYLNINCRLSICRRCCVLRCTWSQNKLTSTGRIF